LTISITEQTTSGGSELNFGELPQKRYKITNEAFSAVDRTNSQQQSSIEYNDNDITGSFDQQSDKKINNLNLIIYIYLQNSSNINNSSYKRYPSSNNQQQIKSFERQDSNTSQSNRQYNLPNNNQQIDSQIYHNRRLNKGGPQPVIPSSTIINQADNNKKSYKNTVLKWSTQPPVSSSTQITNTTSQQEQQKDVETIVATTANLEISPNTVDISDEKIVNNNNNGARKGVLAKSINKNNDNNSEQLTISITEQTTSGGSELNKNNNEASKNLGINIENENKNANYESSSTNANDETNNLSSGSEFAKSKLNPFAQEFVFRSQVMSPLNTSNDGGVGIYTTVNQQPIVNINSQGINYQQAPMPPQHLPHGTQIFINPNTIPPNNPALYIINQTPYQQPAYIPSPIPQPPPPTTTQKQKKGVINESTVVNHNHPMTPNNMQQIPPPQPPPQQQQQQQISQIQSQQRNTQISYQPNQGSYATIVQQQQQQPPPQNTPTPGMVTSYPPPQIPQQPQNQIIYTTQPPMNYQNPSKIYSIILQLISSNSFFFNSKFKTANQ
jgi:hypothetical protein